MPTQVRNGYIITVGSFETPQALLMTFAAKINPNPIMSQDKIHFRMDQG